MTSSRLRFWAIFVSILTAIATAYAPAWGAVGSLSPVVGASVSREHTPLFILNRGQVRSIEPGMHEQDFPISESPFAYTTLHNGARLFVFPGRISLVYYGAGGSTESSRMAGVSEASGESIADRQSGPLRDISMYRVDLNFEGANPACRLEALDRTGGLLRSYRGAAHGYRSPAPVSAVDGIGKAGDVSATYQSIRYHDIYPGVDLLLESSRGGIKYSFVISPGGRTDLISLRWDGASVNPAGDGGLSLFHPAGSISDQAPRAWFEEDGAAVGCRWKQTGRRLRFELDEVAAKATAGSDDGATEKTLILDPFLQWTSYIGGALSDYAQDVVVDDFGNIYVAGYTASPDFPVTTGATQRAIKGNVDVFITRFNRRKQLQWSTYFGGSAAEENPRLALAADGTLYVTGTTGSGDFPVTPDAWQPGSNGKNDAFLAMFEADGSLGWSTYFGGSFSDESNGVAVLPGGEIAIVGGTYSTNLPVTYDALRTSNSGDYDMFVAVFSGGGTRIWATYYGGWSMDYANAVAADSQGNLYVTGHTESTNFPVAGKTQQHAYAGGAFDAFVMKIGRHRQVDWAMYYGGEQEDSGTKIGLDAEGHVIVTGYTASADFPVTASAYRTRHGGILDVFVLSMENNGGLRWATYLGGRDIDRVGGLAVHPDGDIILTGFTGSKDFPVAGNPLRSSKGAGYDVFISKFNAAGGYAFGSFYGGSDHDIGNAVAVDARGNVTIAGGSESPDLARFGTQVQSEIGGLTDGFLIRLIFDEPTADAGRDTVICRGGSAVIGGTVSGGQPPYLYFWRPSEQLSSDRAARPVATPTETTRYIVTVTDTEGAKSSDTIVVSVSMPPIADAGTDVHICPGESHALEGKALGGQAPYTWRWSPGASLNDSTISMPVARPRHSTTYTLTVTDANGCSSRDTVVVNHHAFLIADLGADRSSCAGVSLQLSVSVTGGNQPYSYIWTSLGRAERPGTSMFTVTPVSTSMYMVAVTDINGCRAYDTLRVIVYEPPVLKANVPQTICAGEALRLNATVKGGKTPYTFSWEPAVGVDGANTLRPTVAPLVSTRYVLTLTDARGCVVKDSVTVIVQPPPLVDLGADMEICQNTPVTIGQPATGGNPPYTYHWEPRTGLSAANIAAPSFMATQTRSYRVTVVDASGCSAVDEIKVIVRKSPPMSMTERVNTCPGTPVQLGVNMKGGKPPFSYFWKPATALSAVNIANPAASPLVTTTYSVTVTDATGCRVEGSTTVEVLPPPVVDAGTDMLLCVGTASKLQAHVQGGRKPLSYTWSPPAGLSSTRILNPEINVRQSTVYTLSVMDATGCIVSDAIAVNVFPPPVAGAGPDVEICENGSVSIGVPASGGTPPYRYNWSPVQGLNNPAEATPLASPVATTTYIVRVTDANGCVSTDEMVVSVNGKPRIRLDKEFVICSGQGSLIRPKVSGGTPPYTYRWSPARGLSSAGALDPVVNPDRNTVYTLIVTDARGCSATATVHVVVSPCNKADAGKDVELCLGEKKTIGTSSTDNANKPVYSWKPSKGLSSRRSTNPDASPDKTMDYILSVTNSYGCVSRDTVRVTVHTPPRVNAGPPVTLCPGGSAVIGRPVKGGRAPYTWQWSPSEGLSDASNPTPEASPSVSTTYLLVVSDANGCSARDSVRVRVAKPPSLALGPEVSICSGTSVRIGNRASGGKAPLRYSWSPAATLKNSKSARPTASPKRTTLYTVTVTDARGCEVTDSLSVRVHQLPLAQIRVQGSPVFCKGDSVVLDAGPGFPSYRWSNASRSQRIVVRKSGSYAVTVGNEHGCSAVSDPVKVSVFKRPVPRIAANRSRDLCQGDSIRLDGGKGYQAYHWSNGSTGRFLTTGKPGTYSVTVEGKGGCAIESPALRVTVFPLPLAAVDRRHDLLTASEGAHYKWYRNGKALRRKSKRELRVTLSGKYEVEVFNAADCSARSAGQDIVFGSATVSLPSLRATAGDTIRIPLLISGTGRLAEAGAGSFSATLRVKKKSVSILSGAADESETATESIVTVRGSWEQGREKLATIEAVVKRAGTVTLKLTDFVWDDALVNTTRRNGRIRISARKNR